jgi:hypothetical protein
VQPVSAFTVEPSISRTLTASSQDNPYSGMSWEVMNAALHKTYGYGNSKKVDITKARKDVADLQSLKENEIIGDEDLFLIKQWIKNIKLSNDITDS